MTRDGCVETGDGNSFNLPKDFADFKLTLRQGRDLTSRCLVFKPSWGWDEELCSVYANILGKNPGLPAEDEFILTAISSWKWRVRVCIDERNLSGDHGEEKATRLAYLKKVIDRNRILRSTGRIGCGVLHGIVAVLHNL